MAITTPGDGTGSLFFYDCNNPGVESEIDFNLNGSRLVTTRDDKAIEIALAASGVLTERGVSTQEGNKTPDITCDLLFAIRSAPLSRAWR